MDAFFVDCIGRRHNAFRNRHHHVPTSQRGVITEISATGLDAKTLQLLNRGQWNDAIERLKTLTESSTNPDINHAWLGFSGDMFMDHGDDLKGLQDKLQNMPNGKESTITKTVECSS